MALNDQILAILADNLEFDDGEMDALVAQLAGIVSEQVIKETDVLIKPLQKRIAELETALADGGDSGSKPKVKRGKKTATATGTGAKKTPNAYSKFVKAASSIVKDEDVNCKSLRFTPQEPTADKAISRWASAPSGAIDFGTECTLEDLIKSIKNIDEFSNLMVASSLAWNMIPDSAKQELTNILA